MASNKHLQLTAYFGKHSTFEISDPMYSLLKKKNNSNFLFRNYSKRESTKLKSRNLPSSLLCLKIPIQSFMHGIFISCCMYTVTRLSIINVNIYVLKRKSFATVLHPFFLQCGSFEDISMIISYVPAQ